MIDCFSKLPKLPSLIVRRMVVVMEHMRARRIRTRFHRIGVVLAVLCLMGCAPMFALGTYVLATTDRSKDGLELIFMGAAWIVGAGLAYAAAWTLGWIIAGFAGEEENSS
jgi:hypothetical protein